MKENEIPLRLHPTNPFTKFRKEEIEQSISSRFEQQAAKYPDHIAVNSREQSLSYAELNKAANHLAQAVLSCTMEKNTPVALLLDQGIPFITGILGVLKAGKIFVPLDPDYPLVRNKYMLEDSQADYIVTNKRSFSLAAELTKNKKRLLNIDDINFSRSIQNPCLSLTPDTLAYILYTSGSTGKPKGVVQNHRNLLHSVMRYVNAFHICPEDRQSLLYPCSVDGGMRDIFNALLTGAALYHFPLKEQGISPVADWLIQEKITIYCSVATVFRYFASELSGENEFPELRLVKLGGECIYNRRCSAFSETFFI